MNKNPHHPPYVISYPTQPERKVPIIKYLRWIALSSLLILSILGGLYFFAPDRTNLLLLGIDRTPPGTAQGRSDTIILVTIEPLEPDVSMVSIPRDLWVTLPEYGENRINAAHYFAEIEQPGSGPAVVVDTMEAIFNLQVSYYFRFQFDSYLEILDAIGGVDIEIPRPMSGYDAGFHHLNAEEALAFVRDRSGSDDFYRMERTQLLITSLLRQLLEPGSWSRIPEFAVSLIQTLDTNVPVWQIPRLTLAIVRAGQDGIGKHSLNREMTTPFTTSGGAQVLLPNWDKINPFIEELFNK
jgi:LCP family protein required for cell wall assembly